MTTAKKNSSSNNIYSSKYYKTKSWKENYIWRILISFKCKFWINECVIFVLLYNFISTRHLSRSLVSSSLDFNKNSRLCHKARIVLWYWLCWCKDCIMTLIVLVQRLCWCKKCAGAKNVLMQRLHCDIDCTDVKIVLMQRLHYNIDCTDAKNALVQRMCWCKDCTVT